MSAIRQTFLDSRVTLHCGDCIDVLATMPENSVDSVVCDPPYHLTSIVKRFGNSNPADVEKNATGRKIAGQGTSPHGRAAAGFMGKQWDGGDIAFQPSTWAAVLRVLKPGGYLLAFASTRGFGRMSVAIEDAGFITHPLIAWIFGSGFPKATRIKAEGYEGFRYGGQALKPAIEPIYMGQKPFSEATGTANILRWGTGAVNVDGCRISFENDAADPASNPLYRKQNGYKNGNAADQNSTSFKLKDGSGERPADPAGRWPANVLHDGSDEVLAAFPDSEGAQGIVRGTEASETGQNGIYGKFARVASSDTRNDSGSAARFFYSSKADADDRIGSKHPTVKPVDLIAYLCRLITPPGGTVLDCFAGTGTTGEAAWREGFKAILIEREPEYQADIARRMDLVLKPTKRAAVAKTKNKLMGAEGTPLFGGEAA